MTSRPDAQSHTPELSADEIERDLRDGLISLGADPKDAAQYAKDHNPTDIVGHKTFSDGALGFRHEPLTRAEADEMLARADAEKATRRERMPDVESALRHMWSGYQRLRELGWNDAIYCPKDGTLFEVIEAGSTGIHRCHYDGPWPKGTWWMHGEGDLWPSHPILFRLLSDASEPPSDGSSPKALGESQ